MIIGIPKEIKKWESRVALTPSNVKDLTNDHKVLIQKDAGLAAGFSNEEYEESGAIILDSASTVWEESNLVVKVKEPLKEEYKYFRDDLMLFTYLHLASNKELTEELLKSKTLSIAYETIMDNNMRLPLLDPMSEIAGKVSVELAIDFLKSTSNGKGKLIDGAPGIPPAHIVIIGAGSVGEAAIKRALGLGARVTALDISLDRLKELQTIYGNKLETLYSTPHNIESILPSADILIGSVLVPGRKAPIIVSEDMVKLMEEGSVLIDVAIDQGGCIETSYPTSYDNPTFVKYGVIHSGVQNLPASVGNTSSIALTNKTLPYIKNLVNLGWKDFANLDMSFRRGINTINGLLTNKEVANSLNLKFSNIDKLI